MNIKVNFTKFGNWTEGRRGGGEFRGYVSCDEIDLYADITGRFDHIIRNDQPWMGSVDNLEIELDQEIAVEKEIMQIINDKIEIAIRISL